MADTKRSLAAREVKCMTSEYKSKSWESHHKECSQWLAPHLGRFEGENPNDGKKKHAKILDGHGEYATEVLSAGMQAGITSPARPWFRANTPFPDLNRFRSVKLWLSQLDQIMRGVMQVSNFYGSQHRGYEEIGVFGSSAMLIDEDFQRKIQCYPFTAGTYCLGVNFRHEVDKFCWFTSETVKALYERWGEARLSNTVKSLAADGKWDAYVPVTWLISPRDQRFRDPGKRGRLNMPYQFIAYESKSDNDSILGEGGYMEFPVVCPRWHTIDSDAYGRGPGMRSLGLGKGLQLETQMKLKAMEKMIDPTMQAPADMKGRRVSNLPGKVVFHNAASGGDIVRPTHQINPQGIQFIREDIEYIKHQIDQHFYVDLFLMISQSDRRNITATEVIERKEEKLISLGPVLERVHQEGLDPIINRIYGILERNRMLPPPPPELEGIDLRIEYTSMLAQAQKAIGLAGMERMASFFTALGQVKPEVLDLWNVDETARQYTEGVGNDPKHLLGEEEVKQIRDARAQQAQMAQASAMAREASETTRNMAQAPMGNDDNALDRIVQTISGA